MLNRLFRWLSSGKCFAEETLEIIPSRIQTHGKKCTETIFPLEVPVQPFHPLSHSGLFCEDKKSPLLTVLNSQQTVKMQGTGNWCSILSWRAVLSQVILACVTLLIGGRGRRTFDSNATMQPMARWLALQTNLGILGGDTSAQGKGESLGERRNQSLDQTLYFQPHTTTHTNRENRLSWGWTLSARLHLQLKQRGFCPLAASRFGSNMLKQV